MQLSTDPPTDAVADVPRSPALRAPRRRRHRPGDRAALLRFLAFLVIAAPILLFGLKPTDPVFDSPVHFAVQMLHGKLYFDQDTSFWEMFHRDGRWAPPYAPLATILLIPYVALGGEGLGLAFANTLIILGATSALWTLFRAMRPLRRWAGTAAGAYLIGTPFLYSCAVGDCWLLLHSEENLFMFLALLALQRRRWVWFGFFYAMAVLCRYAVSFSAPMLLPALLGGLLPWWRVSAAGRARHWRRFAGRAIRFLAGAIPPMAAIFCVNWAMTGQPFLTTYELTYRQWGVADNMYGTQYFLSNLKLYFGSMPTFIGHWPYVYFDVSGEAFWVTSPFLLYLLAMRPRTRVLRAALVGAVFTFVPYLFFKWNGYCQVGTRYATDCFPFLVPLAFSAVGLRRSPRWQTVGIPLLYVLIGIGIALNVIAAIERRTGIIGF